MKFAAIQLIVANFVFKMMVKLRNYIFFIFILIGFVGNCQSTFHKVFTLEDTTVLFSNVLSLSDGYKINGNIGLGNIRSNSNLLQLSLEGEIIENVNFVDSNNLSYLGLSYSEIDTTLFGNYLFHYTSVPLNGGNLAKHTIGKVNAHNNSHVEGFLDTLVNGYFYYFAYPRLRINNADSSYYTIGNYTYISSMDSLSNLPDNNGFFVIKFSQLNDSIIFIKRFTYALANPDGPIRAQTNLHIYHDNTILVVSYQFLDHPIASQQYCKTVFYKQTSDGVTTQTLFLQDTQYSRPGFGSTFLNNQKDLLISYTSSELITPPNNTAYWGLTPAVARLDSNFNIIWKKELGGIQFNPYQIASKHLFNKFSIVGDTAFVGAHFRVFYKDDDTLTAHGTLRVMNARTDNGEINWLRDYNFFSDSSGLENSLYEVRDIEQTSDGGFIMVGEVLNYDSLNVGAPGQLGYILKTNCLGFLDDPQAGFTAVPDDSMGVHFTNTSLMGGSYLWDFGDGNSLVTGEYAAFDEDPPAGQAGQAAVFHAYSDTGIYEVMLIAYGCNGANDTLRTTVHVSKNAPEVPVNPNITNYMAIGPNPVKRGESIAVYVGNLPSENCILSFYDERGKVVLEHRITLSNSTNIIVLPFSAGVYQAVLRDGEKKLEVEKVLVH